MTKTLADVKTDSRQKRGESRAERRHTAILDAAQKLLLENGYAAVSMDDIIRVSGGSKATLYKQFGNKEGILAAVVDQLAKQVLEGIPLADLSGPDPREALRQFGLHLCSLAMSDIAVRQHRLAVSSATAYPEAARVWFEAGPNRVLKGLADYLAKETAAGRLKIKDPVRAAHMFGGMVMFYHNMRLLIGLPRPSQPEVKAIVNEAVDLFVQRYGV